MQVELTAAVAKLGVANKLQAAADTQQRANVSDKAEASAVRADANAVQAQQTADSARVTAEAANTQAVISAVAAKVKAYRLMDNRSHDETSWDFELLGPELLDLQNLGYGNLELTGFDEQEIADFLAGASHRGKRD